MAEAIMAAKVRLKKYWRGEVLPELHVKSGRVEVFATKYDHEKCYLMDCLFLGGLPDFNHGFGSRSCKKTTLADLFRRTFELEEERAWDDAVHGFIKVEII